MDNTLFLENMIRAIANAPEYRTINDLESEFLNSMDGKTLSDIIKDGFPESLVKDSRQITLDSNPDKNSRALQELLSALERVPAERRRKGVRLV